MSREDLFTLIPLLVLLVALIFLGISHLQLQDKYEALLSQHEDDVRIINDVRLKNSELRHELTQMKFEMTKLKTKSSTKLDDVQLTAYCPCERCCDQWADGITKTGTKATAGRTIAVDPSVIELGSKVEINGKTYVAEDIGGAIDGLHIDVFFNTHEEAQAFGVQTADVIVKGGKND